MYEYHSESKLKALIVRKVPQKIWEPILARPGIRAAEGSLELALTSPTEMTKQKPKFDKPVRAIEKIIVAKDFRASAKDYALHEVLLAWARENGIQNRTHKINVGLLMSLLDINSTDRLASALVRIAQTQVAFHSRDMVNRIDRKGYGSLISFELESHIPSRMQSEMEQQIASRADTLTYSIPSVLADIYISRGEFTWLDLNAICGFKSKYSHHLYQMLAVRANRDLRLRKHIKMDAHELALKMGWPDASDHLWRPSHFIEECLKPALEDIEANVVDFYVEPFFTEEEEVAETRKRKHTRLKTKKMMVSLEVFQTRIESSDPRLKSKKRAFLEIDDKRQIFLKDYQLPSTSLPSVEAVERAVQARIVEFKRHGLMYVSPRRHAQFLTTNWRQFVSNLIYDAKQNLESAKARTYINSWTEWALYTTNGSELAKIFRSRTDTDKYFEEWARLQHRDNTAPRDGEQRKAPSIVKVMPEQAVRPFKDSFYTMLRDVIDVAENRDKFSQVYKKYDIDIVLTHIQIDGPCWGTAFEHDDFEHLGPLARKAFPIIRRQEINQLKKTIRNLAYALWRHDPDKMQRILKSIVAKNIH